MTIKLINMTQNGNEHLTNKWYRKCGGPESNTLFSKVGDRSLYQISVISECQIIH